MSQFLLNPASLVDQIPAATYARGLEVLRKQYVLECSVAGASASEWHVQGVVLGSNGESYNTLVTLEATSTGDITFFTGNCSCPVGHNCKHAVALVIRAAYKSGGMRTAALPANQANALPARLNHSEMKALQEAQAQIQSDLKRERERSQAQHKVNQWLDLFGDAEPLPYPALAPAFSGKTTSPDVLVYALSAASQAGYRVLQLSVGMAHRQAKGDWTKLKPVRYLTAHQTPPQHQEVIQLIESLAGRNYNYTYSGTRATLSGAAGLLALKLAAQTGHLYAANNERITGEPLQLGPDYPVQFAWHEVKAAPAVHSDAPSTHDPLWALEPVLAADGTACFANTPPLYLNTTTSQCGSLTLPGVSTEHLALLIKAPPIPQSAFERHETTLLRRLAGLPLPPMIEPPEEVKGAVPGLILRITAVDAGDTDPLGLLRATLRFSYQGIFMYAAHNQTPILAEIEHPNDASKTLRVMVHRDLATEQATHHLLRGLGLSGDTQGQFYLPFVSHQQQQLWLQWADDGFAVFKSAGFELEIAPGLANLVQRADSLEVALAAPDAAPKGAPNADDQDSNTSQWFDLSLGMQINGQRQNILPLLPELIAQLGATLQGGADHTTAQMPPFVYLQQAAGNYLRLPTAPLLPWLQALLELVGERSHNAAGDFKGVSLRLSRMEALRVGSALGTGVRWQGADSLHHMISQLGGHSALPAVAAPSGLLATLRPYQLQGLQWLQFLRSHALSGILADDMGLGKTIQTLAHVLIEKHAGRLDRPALIIAPVSLMGNWRKEAERFTPELRTLVLHGADRHAVAGDMATSDVVIAPYSLLQRDRERWLAQSWHVVVLDEAQNIKNANSHAAQVVGELDTRHRLCLSGTPMENHLGELWSLFHFLMPGFLGSQARFKALYRTPIEKYGDHERAAQLRSRVTPFMLRRHKSSVATDLPEKQIAVTSVALDGKQADLYETIRLSTEKTVRDALANKGLAKSQIVVLDALLKLRQVCCDPRLVPLPAAQKVKQSAKLELLMELLPELLAEGRKVLLFSQFTSMLSLIEDELVKRKIAWVKLTGQSQKRDALIERFTSGEVPLFLISLKAGGVGLNLTQADTVIHYDPWWNPAAETQATDRAHRIGQTQRVMVYKLVAQGTIEERILALQDRKAALANSLYSESVGRKEPLFTENDLAALLKPLGV